MVLFKYVQTSKLSRVAKEIEALHNAFLKQDEPMALRIFNFDIDDSINNSMQIKFQIVLFLWSKSMSSISILLFMTSFKYISKKETHLLMIN